MQNLQKTSPGMRAVFCPEYIKMESCKQCLANMACGIIYNLFIIDNVLFLQ